LVIDGDDEKNLAFLAVVTSYRPTPFTPVSLGFYDRARLKRVKCVGTPNFMPPKLLVTTKQNLNRFGSSQPADFCSFGGLVGLCCASLPLFSACIETDRALRWGRLDKMSSYFLQSIVANALICWTIAAKATR
jgi:hypothetical protein